eukprot:805685-Rhodomonas_salina.1
MTLMESTFRVTDDMIDANAPPERVHKYQSMISCAVFCQIWTRLDIGYSVNVLSRYLMRPSEALVKQAKKLLCYLKYSRELGLRFAKHPRVSDLSFVTAYMDASDADCLITRKSAGGHILFIGLGLTVWKVGQSPIVTLSTAESELVQICMAVQDVKHLHDILEGLGFPQETTRMHEDNQAAIQLAENACYRAKTKHMGRRYRFIREAIENKEVVLLYCLTEYNMADIFTKQLSHERFVYLHNILLGY